MMNPSVFFVLSSLLVSCVEPPTNSTPTSSSSADKPASPSAQPGTPDPALAQPPGTAPATAPSAPPAGDGKPADNAAQPTTPETPEGKLPAVNGDGQKKLPALTGEQPDSKPQNGGLPYHSPLEAKPPKETPPEQSPPTTEPIDTTSKPSKAHQDGEWKTWTSPSEIYQLSFPGKPEEIRRRMKTSAGEVDQTNAILMFAPSGAYTTSIYPYTTKDKQQFLVQEAKQMAANYGMTLSEEDLTKISLQTYPGVSFSGKGRFSAMGKVDINCRLYLLENDVIQLITFSQEGAASRFDFKRFFDSFKLVQ